jgi:hypothetical protein
MLSLITASITTHLFLCYYLPFKGTEQAGGLEAFLHGAAQNSEL